MARVFVVEDDPFQREIIREFLLRGEHKVVLETGDFDKALELIRAGKIKELGIDLAILDGSLRPKSPNDGAEIAAALRGQAPEVKIIGLSAFQVTFGDANLQKPVSLREFLDVITKLGL